MATQKKAAPTTAPGKGIAKAPVPAPKKDQPIALAMMQEDAGAGLENTDKDSFVVPFLMILQKGSPQVDRAQPEFIKGAEVGDIMISTTQELFKEEGVSIMICFFDRKFLRWRPRDDGGGFRGALSPSQFNEMLTAGEITQTDSGFVNEEGDIIKDTRIHYVLVIRKDGSYQPAVLSTASTQVKKSKQLMTQLDNYKQDGPKGKFTPPTWAHIFRATTVAESNDKGSWSGWKFVREGFVEDAELYAAGKAFHKTVTTTEVKMDLREDSAV